MLTWHLWYTKDLWLKPFKYLFYVRFFCKTQWLITWQLWFFKKFVTLIYVKQNNWLFDNCNLLKIYVLTHSNICFMLCHSVKPNKDHICLLKRMVLHILQMNYFVFFHLISYRKKKLWIIFFSDSILILLLYAELILFVFVVKMNAIVNVM